MAGFTVSGNVGLTSADIARQVKRQFGDEAGAQITDPDIIDWINAAQREIADKNQLMQTYATCDLTAGVQFYVQPDDSLSVIAVYDNVSKAKARFLSLQEYDELFLREDMSVSISPPLVWTLQGLQICIYPIPPATVANGLAVLYNQIPTKVTAIDVTVLALPAGYHQAVFDYVLGKALELDENYQMAGSQMNKAMAGAKYTRSNTELGQDKYPFPTLPNDWDE